MSSSQTYDPASIPGLAGPPPIQVLPRKWAPRIAALTLILPIGLAVLYGGAWFVLNQPSNYPWIGGCLLGGLAILAFTAWRYWTESTRRVALYDTGLELIASGKRSTIRFEHIEEVWFAARRMQTGGLIGMAVLAIVDKIRKNKSLDERGVMIQMRVVGGDTTIKLNNYDKGVFAAYQEIIRRANPRLILDGRKRIDSGGTVTFNKVSLSREGLTFGKKTIQLAQIEKITIKEGGFSVKVKDKWLKSGQPVARIPNLYVLTELVAQLSGGTIEMDIPMGMNLASRYYCG